MSKRTVKTDSDGSRDARGRFRPGNKAARGNPNAKRAFALRTELASLVSDVAFRKVVRKLVAQAEAGEEWAVKLLLGYTVGKPVQPVENDVEIVGADAVAEACRLLGIPFNPERLPDTTVPTTTDEPPPPPAVAVAATDAAPDQPGKVHTQAPAPPSDPEPATKPLTSERVRMLPQPTNGPSRFRDPLKGW